MNMPMHTREARKPITTSSRLRATLEKVETNSRQIAEAGSDTQDLLRLLSFQRQLGNQALDLGILLTRERGASWGTIAKGLGLSPQALEQRMRRLAAH